MQLSKNRSNSGGRLIHLPPDQIRSNPGQPRRRFDRDGMRELTESISRSGVLQPLLVRKSGAAFELVAGERRLRAARMAGLKEVPCLVVSLDEAESSLVALVENLQRRDLDCWEEADGIAKLMRLCGLNQEQAAERLGKSPSSVANKLRLLKHSPVVRAALQTSGLSERHARALLRLPDDRQRLEAIRVIVSRDLTVAKTEAYVDELLSVEAKPERPARKLLVKDLRLFLNSVSRHLETLRQAGFTPELRREESENDILLTIRLPKQTSIQNIEEPPCAKSPHVI
ncbi:MAG: ParB/RepB/Spo0J family partition protein [Oscillospiraceae bacterium]|nr:ParB/RepB/Spo0J family partition protein [Oscillospiraceae bacterium]